MGERQSTHRQKIGFFHPASSRIFGPKTSYELFFFGPQVRLLKGMKDDKSYSDFYLSRISTKKNYNFTLVIST